MASDDNNSDDQLSGQDSEHNSGVDFRSLQNYRNQIVDRSEVFTRSIPPVSTQAIDVDEIYSIIMQQNGQRMSQILRTSTSRSLLSREEQPAAPQPPQHFLIFWNDGFTIDGGPLRRFQDHVSFLERIERGYYFDELNPIYNRPDMTVDFTRVPQNCPTGPFQGVRRILDEASSSTIASATLPSSSVDVDPTQPWTLIQLRLADGTCTVARFNLRHTIGDIHVRINTLRPRGSRIFRLQNARLPPTQFDDLNQTIEQAGIGNSVVIQRLYPG